MRASFLALSVLALLSCVPGTSGRLPGAPARGEGQPQLGAAPIRPTDPDELRPAPASRGGRLSGLALHAAQLVELEQLSDEELARRIDRDLDGLGPMSLGRPSAGALLNGVPMPEGDDWEVVVPGTSFATQETVDYLVAAIEHVHERYPDTHKTFIGDISRQLGGPLRPHRSHQSGRDVDLSYYYLPGKVAWYQPANARTLDVERSWALVRALLTETDVEMMFIDLRVQKLLKEHALSIGEDPEWLDRVFQFGSHRPSPIIRHAWGHATHIHVRFYNPYAQELGRRCYELLAERELITPTHRYVRYRAQASDNLAAVATRAGCTVGALRRMNGLRAGGLVAGRSYLVPLRGRVARVGPLVVPPRQLPPAWTPSGVASLVPAAP